MPTDPLEVVDPQPHQVPWLALTSRNTTASHPLEVGLMSIQQYTKFLYPLEQKGYSISYQLTRRKSNLIFLAVKSIL